jgi:hypothetical protein
MVFTFPLLILAWFDRNRIKNALTKVCLAGAHLASQLGHALDAFEADPGDNFILLLSNPETQQYRALYSFDPTTGEVCGGCASFVFPACLWLAGSNRFVSHRRTKFMG